VTVKVLVPLRVLPANKAPLPDQETGAFTNVFPVTVPLPPVIVSGADVKVFDTRLSGEVPETITVVLRMVAPVIVGVPEPDAWILSRLPIKEPGWPVTVPATFSLTGDEAQVPPLLLVMVSPAGTVKFWPAGT
jgi:hypothetical protein